jgi:NAD(P)-dependent dehydrogenase (short-subunit alcohol dehydrogenase family)
MQAAERTFDLSDQVTVVTGGSRGIGRAIVRGFARAGAHVVIASRNVENCRELAREVEAATACTALPVACHTGHWADCDRLVETVYNRFGRCDVFVNNAGMSPRYPDLTSISEEYYDKVHGVNAKGPFRLGALVGTRMHESAGGSIINIGTTGSLRPGKDQLVYDMAKAALNALTIGLSDAFAPNVRVNAILPGGIETDVAKHWPGDYRRALSEDTPLGRIGQPEELVPLALYLASSASSYTNGTLIRVDGGGYRQM